MNNYMLLSTPSSGTDWLSPIIAKAANLTYHNKEFFNPLCNWKLTDSLAEWSGCEMASCIEHIASEHVPPLAFEAALSEWNKSTCNFDKEVWSLSKLAMYAKYFRCVLLYRSPEQTFPPGRARVLAWYDAMFHSLRMNGYNLKSGPLLDRCIAAHNGMWAVGRDLASQMHLPVVNYDDLFGTRSDVAAALDVGWCESLDADRAASMILDTRQRKHTR